jgi:hypothetical protein
VQDQEGRALGRDNVRFVDEDDGAVEIADLSQRRKGKKRDARETVPAVAGAEADGDYLAPGCRAGSAP